MSSLPNLLPGSFPFLRFLGPAPSAPWSLELPGRGCDCRSGGWGGSSPSRCHPRFAAPGAQLLPALLRTRAREERGSIPPSKQRLRSVLILGSLGHGAGGVESRAALPALPPVCAKWDSSAAPILHTGTPARSSTLIFMALDRNLRLASLLGPYFVFPGSGAGVGWRRRERLRRSLASRRALPGGQVGSVGAGARRASAVWFPLRLQAINKLPLGRMRAASKGGFPPNRAGGL